MTHDSVAAGGRLGPPLPSLSRPALAGWGLAAGALLLVLYLPTVVPMVETWAEDENASHGFFVPLVSLWIAWKLRPRLAALPARGSWWGAGVLGLGLIQLVIGAIAVDPFLMRSSLPVTLAGMVLLHLGPAHLRLLLFPIAYLLFMIPLPAVFFYALTFPLQGLAVGLATRILTFLGIPVLVEGHVINLAHLRLGVTEACSGIRSLVALLAFATAWAYLRVHGRGLQVLIILCAVPAAVLANCARVVATALIASGFGSRAARGFYHDASGWASFLLALAGLFAAHAALRALSRRVPRP